MGQLFKSFKRFDYTTSTYLNSSKNCSNDSTMTGMKIAIIFFAIAMISLTADAVPFNLEECEECVKECNGKKIEACPEDLVERFICIFVTVLFNTEQCRIECRKQGICEY